MYTIDKSVFTAEELEQYEALIAKAKVDPEAAKEEMEEQEPSIPQKKPAKKAEVEDMEETKKSAPVAQEASPELKAAMDELASLRKSFEMKEMAQVAKKYAPLGKKEDELAQTLYDMKKSNEANYNAYIAVLDESLGLVEKSGVFSEIGKSAPGVKAQGGAVAKVEAAADAIMKADPSMTRVEAVAKAWTDHPEFVAEYEAEYRG